ncbi:HAD family hydrolase [Paenibacillus sacheonensis]|uniref:HAD-IA family hydrolase n=1 Tax=Paenibacillus sacheonensis TaxID=742054 RepID=A0A7X5C4C5_9BACL|nr:HAD-IA family hydrolase [Paenibacillus sacheonensis]MBM7567978.1 HAD superfamily hydrolase (TIGR01549 family) [Paenibacillus sacheonensis]NBC73185.1 HAD-IA family hydrolase [Paenibacillus sacheonensis]
MVSLNENDLKDKIVYSEIVSFDVFDTLLLRNVMRPTDVFKAVEQEINEYSVEPVNFSRIRVAAEEKARRVSGREEITFEEIYAQIEYAVGRMKANEFKQLELKLESQFLIANRDLMEIFNFARSLKKKIYLISDMYLASQDVSRFLMENGCEGYDQLFISSELNVTKASGSMYQYIRVAEKINSNEKWIHIGDNYTSDYLNARKNNIEGYYYKKISERESIPSDRTLGESIISAIQLNHKYTNNEQDYWYKFGSDIVAPIYIGLMRWIAKKIKDQDNLYFLARDGFMPHKLYQIMRTHIADLPEGKYLYASRRAYIYPQLIHADVDHAIETLMLHNEGFKQKLTLIEIIENVGLEGENYQRQLGRFNIGTLDEVVNEKNALNIKAFLTSIWSDIQEVLEKELTLLEAYLKQNDVYQQSSINIFDVGWRGSTHLALQDIVGGTVKGMYFGTLDNIYYKIKADSCGYAFNEGAPFKNKKMIMKNVMMYEFLFSSPEGSVFNFTFDHDNKVIPVLNNSELQTSTNEATQRFQQGATDVFIKSMAYYKFTEEVGSDYALSRMQKFINEQNALDMLHFSKLSNSVGLGKALDAQKYATEVDLIDYLMNRNMHNASANCNLWKMAIVIKDSQGRHFNRNEIEKLYNIRYGNFKTIVNHYVSVFKKAVRNPRKTMKRMSMIIKKFFR